MVYLEIDRTSFAEKPGEAQKSLLNIPRSCDMKLRHEVNGSLDL
jgi:hypothetical protein